MVILVINFLCYKDMAVGFQLARKKMPMDSLTGYILDGWHYALHPKYLRNGPYSAKF